MAEAAQGEVPLLVEECALDSLDAEQLANTCPLIFMTAGGTQMAPMKSCAWGNFTVTLSALWSLKTNGQETPFRLVK